MLYDDYRVQQESLHPIIHGATTGYLFYTYLLNNQYVQIKPWKRHFPKPKK